MISVASTGRRSGLVDFEAKLPQLAGQFGGLPYHKSIISVLVIIMLVIIIIMSMVIMGVSVITVVKMIMMVVNGDDYLSW